MKRNERNRRLAAGGQKAGGQAADAQNPAPESADAPLFLLVEEGADLERASRIAKRLGIEVVQGEADRTALHLTLGANGLSLEADGLSMRGDFSAMLPRLKGGRIGTELLVRAARPKRADGELLAVDATAGMGEDALLLAAAGFRVILCERNPVIASLLEDTMRRAAAEENDSDSEVAAGAAAEEENAAKPQTGKAKEENAAKPQTGKAKEENAATPQTGKASERALLREAVGRMELRFGDSERVLAELAQQGVRPNVVVLDPMFPERHKSGLVRKKFQLLHNLEEPCTDEAQLLAAALAAAPRRIVIKRPLHGPWLGGRKPDWSLEGKAIRYDCLLPAGASDKKL